MKKKIILIPLMIMVFLSVFAISVFAEDIVVSKTQSEEYGTVIQLNADPGLDNAGQYVSTLKKITDNGDSTQDYSILTDGEYYYVFPSSYIVWELEDGKLEIYAGTQDQPGLAQAMAEFNAAMQTSYYSDYTIASSGAGRRLEALVRFEFPSDVSYADKDYCCIREYPKLLEVRFNHEFNVSKAEKLFYKCTKLQTVIGFETVSGTMPKTVFASCVNLGFIKLPTDMTSIPGSMFQGCNSGNLSIANFSELTQLTTIESWAFDGCQRLVITLPDSVTKINTNAFGSAFKYAGSITINPTSQLKTIGEKAFSDCGKLQEIYIPSTVTSIGKNAFDGANSLKALENFENCQITTIYSDTFKNATSLTSIKLPKTVTTIEAAFSGNTNLKTVYIPSSVTSIADTFVDSSWNKQSANIVFFYVSGSDTSVFESCATISNANKISLNEYDETKTYTGINLVVNYSDCVAYNNGVHPSCSNDIVVTSYLEDIKVVSKCNLCGLYDENGKIEALFSCLGYSTPESGNGGISIGYRVNGEAIVAYEEITGETVSYGLFATTKQGLGEDDIIGENGEAGNGTLIADIGNEDFTFIFIKMFGFDTDEQKKAEFAIGAFVGTTKEGVTTYSYLQASKPAEGEKYAFIKYNDFITTQA